MINSIFELLNKYNISQKESLLISESILNNQLVVKYRYLPEDIDNPIEELIYGEDFNWWIELQDNTNMAMLHLHSWEPVNYLLIAHYYTADDQYITKAMEIIQSWYKHSISQNHKYLYYPHCVADRALILSYLVTLNKNLLDVEPISILFKKHKSYLVKENNHVKYNHGTMMDRSLITMCIISNDKNNLEFAINRICCNVSETFTDNMICVENSFTYAVFNLELIISTQKYLLDNLNVELFPNFDLKIRKALTFLDIVKKPDGFFPMYGDGELIHINKLKNSLIFKYYPDHNLFSIKIYSDEAMQSFYYKNEGYLIIKNHYFHFFLRTGDIVKNHKHADDLSFTLYIGKDILVDPGTYNYDKGEMRSYLKSAAAHNSIVLNNENYDYLNKNSSKNFIYSFEEYADYYHIILINKGYSFANITRNIYIMKQDYSLILYDYIQSPLDLNISQIFNFSKFYKDSFKTKLSLDNTLTINNEIILNSKNIDDIEIDYNKETVYSEKFHQSEIIPKITFLKNGRNQSLITSLSVSNNNAIKNLSTSNTNLSLNYNKKNIVLPAFLFNEDINLDRFIHIYMEKNEYRIKIYFNYFYKQEYALYIYNSDNREAILWYQDSPEFIYNFETSGDYRIRCFVRNKENKSDKSEFSIYKNIRL